MTILLSDLFLLTEKKKEKVSVSIPATGDRDDDALLRTLLGRNERLVSALNHTVMTKNQPVKRHMHLLVLIVADKVVLLSF